jgi:starvation-inducible DNA-binding protein
MDMPNSLSTKTKSAMADLLNVRLAELIDLASHAKDAHWNVRGSGFAALHELFDEVAMVAGAASDDAAERVVQLGGRAKGTIQHVSEVSTLPKYPAALTDLGDHAAALGKSIAWVSTRLREAIDDAAEAGDHATADLFTQHTRALDKILWMVEAHAD